MSISKVRSAFYKIARVLGDFAAIKKGPKSTTKRVGRRAAGKATGRLLRKLFR